MTKLIFLGASNLVRLLKSSFFQKSFDSQNVVNLCKSGACVADGIELLENFIRTEFDPTQSYQIVILLGTNDLKSPEKFDRDNYKVILKICRKYFSHIFICKIPPSPKFDSSRISLINKWLNCFHSVHEISIVDSFTPFLDKSLFFQKFYRNGKTDNVHFSSPGLKLLTSLIRTQVESFVSNNS